MINSRIVPICFIAGVSWLSGAYASDIEKPYLGLDYSHQTYTNGNAGASDAILPSVRIRAGSEVTRYVAVEAQIVAGTTEDDVNITTLGGTTTYKVSAPPSYGAYLRPQLPIGSHLTIYGLAGYSYAKLKYSPSLLSGSSSSGTHDVSYGGGVQVNIGEHLSLNADFVHIIKGLESVNGGISWRF